MLHIPIIILSRGKVFEQIGAVNQLPAAIFCLAGVYLMARMRTWPPVGQALPPAAGLRWRQAV